MLNKKMYDLGKTQSIIREQFLKGLELKKQYGNENVFDFSLGNPNIKPPDVVNQSLKKIIDTYDDYTLHGYTIAQGDNKVRLAIADYMNKKYDANANEDFIYLTVGAASGISICLKALLNEDDEVIVFAPYFPEYDVFIKNANGKTIVVEPDINTFYPNMLDFENKISKKTKAIIINSPNNPTGVFYKENIIKQITEITNKKQIEYKNNIFIISDEPYRELLYTSDKYVCINKYYDNSIITYSFSKSLSLPGERIGYILLNNNCLIKNDLFYCICGAGRSMGYVCANSLFQHLIPYVIDSTSDIKMYVRNRDYMYDNLKKIGYEIVKPDGAYYLFVKSLLPDALEFSKICLKYNIVIVPSDTFGMKGYFRISYCVDYNTIVNSIKSFKDVFDEVKNV